ncbi:MAG: tetratricopeptide repeat protein [Candidatus Rokuibacteriota bacterium]
MTRVPVTPCRALLVLVAVLGLVPGVVAARSPLVDELSTLHTQYHRDPGRLDVVRDGLRRAAAEDPSLEHLIAFAHVSFIWGDVRATAREQKLAAYDEGRQAARRAVALDPRSVVARFWLGSNTARWGQANGIVRSLFLLPEVKDEMRRVLELDPRFAAGYALNGNVLLEVPGLLGGDVDRAEEMFRKGLALDPRFTSMRIGLARSLIKQGRLAEARRELQAVLQTREPRNPADWTVKDVPRARDLLRSLDVQS